MKMLRSAVIVALLLLPALASAQDPPRFPQPLRPGETFRASAAIDTLFWVMKSAQFTRALAIGKELELANETIATLQQKSTLQDSVITEKDGIITELREGYDRYKTKWEECDIKLEEEEIKVVKLRRSRIIFGVAGLAIGAGAILLLK